MAHKKKKDKVESFLRQILRNQMDILDALPSVTWIDAKDFKHDLRLRWEETNDLIFKEDEK